MVKWLLESDVFDEGVEDLANEITKQGMETNIISYIPCSDEQTWKKYNDDDCVVFYGSLNFARFLQKNASWIPGVYYNVQNFNCSTYYNYFGKYHINEDYLMLPYGDLERRKDFLFDTLGQEDTIFIRPDSGSKQFTGQMATKETWESDMKLVGFYEPPVDLMCVISSPKNIVDETRFVVVGSEIITGSWYNKDRKHCEETIAMDSDNEFLSYARMILDNVEWRPDRVFVLDVCKTKTGNLYLLEIGCFSCAGMYSHDKSIIVKRVSEEAWKEYKEYQI